MNTHPKALEAQARAEQTKADRAEFKEYTAKLIAHGVRFIEILPRRDRPVRMTVAYYKDRRNIFAVANTLCHPDEHFDKLRGRVIAGTRLSEGHAIYLRKPANTRLSDAEWLRYTFEGFAI